MTARLRNLLRSEKIRFLVAGGSTTALSYACYLLLLLVMGSKPAYVVSYTLGIAWSYWVNCVWVFRRPPTWKGLISFPLAYLLQAFLSFLLFALVVDALSVPDIIAPLLVIVVMLPLTYLLGRMVIHRTSPAPTDSSEKRPP